MCFTLLFLVVGLLRLLVYACFTCCCFGCSLGFVYLLCYLVSFVVVVGRLIVSIPVL